MTRPLMSPIAIYWRQGTGKPFLYGTHLSYQVDGQVIFDNPLMSSGTIIQEWHSHGVYQATREISPLPLLVPGQTYELIADMQSQPAQRVFIGISFFNRYDQKLGFKVLKEQQTRFSVPPQTYHYCIQLMNAGCSRLRFNGLKLQAHVKEDSDTQSPVVFKRLMHADATQDTLQLVFLEEHSCDEAVLRQFSQTHANVFIQPFEETPLSQHTILTVVSKIHDLKKRYGFTRLNLIGYNRNSNLLALYYGTIFANSQVYVTEDWASLEAYRHLGCDSETLQAIIDTKTYHNVSYYAQKPTGAPYFTPTKHTSARLLCLPIPPKRKEL